MKTFQSETFNKKRRHPSVISNLKRTKEGKREHECRKSVFANHSETRSRIRETWRKKGEGNGKSWRVLPSSGWSFLNHSTVGTGFPSPLSQYKEIDEPSFIGPKVAPVLNVFFVFSSMTRTNAGCTETETKKRGQLHRLECRLRFAPLLLPLFSAAYATEFSTRFVSIPRKANQAIRY